MNKNNNPSTSIVQEKDELESICRELDLEDIKYLPSPKEPNANISDLTKHATAMLNIYKQYKEEGKSDFVTEIFEVLE